ncbi:hypothetical protein, partial [Pantoea dispersa]|uniref:hypothetical protein n=1 Tax=Pantoea dispersa TaxID=59814 RepID=UPI0015E8BD1B
RDPDLGKVVLYQLSYSRICLCFTELADFIQLLAALLPFDAMHSTYLTQRVNRIIHTLRPFAAF